MSDTFYPPVDTSAIYAAIPSPATAMPPSVSEVGAKGTNARYALEDHTHASQLRKARLQTAVNGTLTWVFDVPFPTGTVPRINAIAETTLGNTDVVNVQVEGTPTATQALIRVTRTQQSVVGLIGLTVLSIPTSVGATWVHLSAAQS
jgi:hypothetical protein